VSTSAVYEYCLTGLVQIIVWLLQNKVWLVQMPDEFPKIVNFYDEAAYRN
jgi:hypothetical protein